MPDITMCQGGDCEYKSNCYRFTAEPNLYRQSYFQSPPFTVDVSVSSQRIFTICDYFVRNDEK